MVRSRRQPSSAFAATTTPHDGLAFRLQGQRVGVRQPEAKGCHHSLQAGKRSRQRPSSRQSFGPTTPPPRALRNARSHRAYSSGTAATGALAAGGASSAVLASGKTQRFHSNTANGNHQYPSVSRTDSKSLKDSGQNADPRLRMPLFAARRSCGIRASPACSLTRPTPKSPRPTSCHLSPAVGVERGGTRLSRLVSLISQRVSLEKRGAPAARPALVSFRMSALFTGEAGRREVEPLESGHKYRPWMSVHSFQYESSRLIRARGERGLRTWSCQAEAQDKRSSHSACHEESGRLSSSANCDHLVANLSGGVVQHRLLSACSSRSTGRDSIAYTASLVTSCINEHVWSRPPNSWVGVPPASGTDQCPLYPEKKQRPAHAIVWTCALNNAFSPRCHRRFSATRPRYNRSVQFQCTRSRWPRRKKSDNSIRRTAGSCFAIGCASAACDRKPRTTAERRASRPGWSPLVHYHWCSHSVLYITHRNAPAPAPAALASYGGSQPNRPRSRLPFLPSHQQASGPSCSECRSSKRCSLVTLVRASRNKRPQWGSNFVCESPWCRLRQLR